ncbi:MAG: CRISPR system precrRNA processing endoribonuclease RAMP protein Cas6 [Syntrophobacteraceae bacterium]|jgi:hypothetical protein
MCEKKFELHVPFQYERFRFNVEVQTPIKIPLRRRPILRDAICAVFKQIFCVKRVSDCDGCDFIGKCSYIAVFETQPFEDDPDVRKFSKPPRPYVVNPPLEGTTFDSQSMVCFDLVLFGATIDLLPSFVLTVITLGRKGIGTGKGRYKLIGVDLIRNGKAIPLYDPETRSLADFSREKKVLAPNGGSIQSLYIQFLTPLRLKKESKLLREFQLPVFMERLSDRMAHLTKYYGSGSIDGPSIVTVSSGVSIHRPHRNIWLEWERLGRERIGMKFGGIVGTVVLKGNLTPLIPYLKLAEEINVGLETVFGLGRIRISEESFSLQPAETA